MSITPVKAPKNLAEFVSGDSATDLQKIEDLLNAIQNLRVSVTLNGQTQTVTTAIRITGGYAILELNL